MHSSIAKFSTSSLALAAALLATPVFAQDTNVVDQADSSNEIVVTAQRREQVAAALAGGLGGGSVERRVLKPVLGSPGVERL